MTDFTVNPIAQTPTNGFIPPATFPAQVPRNDSNLSNVAIAVQPLPGRQTTDYDLPPILAAEKYASLFPHVSKRGYELLHVLVHGAANLPIVDGRQPRSYVTVQSRSTMSTQDIGQIINSTVLSDGISPHWNEMIFAEIPDEFVETEEIIILIIDEPRQRTLAEHRFPWRWLEPFYQYHLNLQYTQRQTAQTSNLFISIMRKQSVLSKEDIRYFGLEVLLNRFENSLPNKQVMYAVGRVVPNYETYKHEYLRNLNNGQLGIDFRLVNLSLPNEFMIPTYSYTGYPQMSLASKESKLPAWLHNFMFSHENEKDNMFSNTSTLVIEFYPFQNVSNNPNWRIRGLLGWVAIRLDSRSYETLTGPVGAEGVRTEGLLVESDGDLVTENSKHLTAEVLLRLVSERRPNKNLLAYAASNLPVLPSYYVESTRAGGPAPVYIQAALSRQSTVASVSSQQLPVTGATTLPTQTVIPPITTGQVPIMIPPTYAPTQGYMPYSAGQTTLAPVYQTNPMMPPTQKVEFGQYRVPRINQFDLDDIPAEFRALLTVNFPPRYDEDVDGWFDYFQREIANYKQGFRRVIKDLIQLRDQHKTLTAANTDLKVKVDNFEKKKKVLSDIVQGDQMDKAKIQEIFNRLSAKISAQVVEIKELQAKVANSEKDGIRRQELRTQYDSLQRSVQTRENEVRVLRERVIKNDGLEETVRRQELVIEKLETMIQNYIKEKRSRGIFTDTDRTLLTQHAVLGREVQQDLQRRPVIQEQPLPPPATNTQRDEFLRQSRIKQQETDEIKKRFRENAAAWGREKAELLARIKNMEQSSNTPRPRRLEPI